MYTSIAKYYNIFKNPLMEVCFLRSIFFSKNKFHFAISVQLEACIMEVIYAENILC